MARKTVPCVRWKVKTPPPVADIVNTAFAAFMVEAAGDLEGVSPLLRRSLSTARTGVISAALRTSTCKRRVTKVKLAVAGKFAALRKRIEYYGLTGCGGNTSALNLRIDLLEADIIDKLQTALEK